MRILLEGRPGVGKTTLARAVAWALLERGVGVSGFTTEEIRAEGRRVGFAIEAIGGERAVLAHVELPGPPRVGKYGVDVGALERVALASLDAAADVLVIDELGKMELSSGAFRAAVLEAIEGDGHILATVHSFRHPFTDELKARSDVEVLELTRGNRTAVLDRLVHSEIARSRGR